MRTKWLLIGVALLTAVLAIGAIACSDDDDDNGDNGDVVENGDNGDTSGSTLADVRDRGKLVCGVNGCVASSSSMTCSPQPAPPKPPANSSSYWEET